LTFLREWSWESHFVEEFVYKYDPDRLYQKIELTSLNGTSVFIYNTHLIGDPSKKEIQTMSSNQLLNDVKNTIGASVVCGDFNATEEDEAYLNFSKRMESSQKNLCQKGKKEPAFTFRTDAICKTCDFIWYNDQLKLNGGIHHFYDTIHSPIPDKEHSSDHIPITASFEFRKSIKSEYPIDSNHFGSSFVQEAIHPEIAM
jgi:endonuclease/exonuclease/phosphatase family metal-dependent hydrolase